jgi:CIC family chloride channel protein
MCVERAEDAWGRERAAFRAWAVQRIMLRRWISLGPQASLYEAERLMRLARLRQVPIVADGILLGVVTYRDLLRATVDQLVGEADPATAETVSAFMAAQPATIAPSAPLTEAAERMAAEQLGCLPVVEPSPAGPSLVGILTEADLLRVAYDPLFVVAERV